MDAFKSYNIVDTSLPAELSFNDTRIAFASKSDAALKRSYYLFKLINNSLLVRLGKPLTELAFFLRLPISPLIRQTIFKQFCGGETVEESVSTAEELAKSHISSILDYSVEGSQEESVFLNTTNEVIKTVNQTILNKHIPFSVFKVSGLGLPVVLENISSNKGTPADIAHFEQIRDRVDSICQAAAHACVPVMLDAEESWIQPAIDMLATEMMERYNKERVIVLNTFQLYRTDRLEFLKLMYKKASLGGFKLGVKLVRGAYMEKERARASRLGLPSPIHSDKQSTDRDYDLAQEFCLSKADILFISGTHNEQSCAKLAASLTDSKLAGRSNRVWFAQLLGMSDNLSYNLANAKFNVAKYLPYGPVKAVMPYLLRRAEENTAISGQMGREYALIRQEMIRRGMSFI